MRSKTPLPRGESANEQGDESKELEDVAIVDLENVDGSHSNTVYDVWLADGSHGYLKPETGETPYLRGTAIPEGQEWRREVATCHVDRALGLGVVPETVARHEADLGIENASLQAEAPREGKPYEEYSELDRQKMAVLDYVVANTDRHHLNYKTQDSGRPAAIDNGLALPENDSEGIRSQWVADAIGKPLDESLVMQIRDVDERQLADTLKKDGISKYSVDGLIQRLHEVQRGAITGDAWRGEIYGGDMWPTWNLIRDRL